jgi:hypothetical protein
MADKAKPVTQAGKISEVSAVAAEVGVSHSSVDLHYFKRCSEPRGDACSTHRGEAKDKEMAWATRIVTPNKVRELQIVLYRKAKAQPQYRFWSLYGELLREDVLSAALEVQVRNGGAPGVDGETLESVNAKSEVRQQWLARLREERRTKSYRPNPVGRVIIPKSSGGERPLGIPTVKDRVVQTAVCMPCAFQPILPAYSTQPRGGGCFKTLLPVTKSNGSTEESEGDWLRVTRVANVSDYKLMAVCRKRSRAGRRESENT